MAVTKRRRCIVCGTKRSISRFYLYTKRSGVKAYRNQCIYCCNAQSRDDYYKRDKFAHSSAQRRSHVKRTFGLSDEDHRALLKKQRGVCAICRQPEKTLSSRGVPHSLSVDHNHQTGLVRGLLCRKCNAGLGHFNDSPALLNKAAKYLRKY